MFPSFVILLKYTSLVSGLLLSLSSLELALQFPSTPLPALGAVADMALLLALGLVVGWAEWRGTGSRLGRMAGEMWLGCWLLGSRDKHQVQQLHSRRV